VSHTIISAAVMRALKRNTSAAMHCSAFSRRGPENVKKLPPRHASEVAHLRVAVVRVRVDRLSADLDS
jgi:hypothetical protein